MSVEATVDSMDRNILELLQEKLPGAETARTMVVAGSGLGGFVESIKSRAEISYADIPGVGGSTVAGHAGKLIFAGIGSDDVPALVMAGRRHIYEGLSAEEAVRLPQLVMAAFPNIESLIISNAAGGMNPAFAVGNLMLITDHINWMNRHPLHGAKQSAHPGGFTGYTGPVFDPGLRALAYDTARELKIGLREGTYIAMMGPSYETRAEIAMIRHLFAADAVGMSTVPESIAAAAAGRRVLGISFISNMLVEALPTTHAEVVANAVLVEESFGRLVTALVEKLHAQG